MGALRFFIPVLEFKCRLLLGFITFADICVLPFKDDLIFEYEAFTLL
jgi:hypothetical protein